MTRAGVDTTPRDAFFNVGPLPRYVTSAGTLGAALLLLVGTLVFFYLAFVTGQLLLGAGIRAISMALAAGVKRRG